MHSSTPEWPLPPTPLRLGLDAGLGLVVVAALHKGVPATQTILEHFIWYLPCASDAVWGFDDRSRHSCAIAKEVCRSLRPGRRNAMGRLLVPRDIRCPDACIGVVGRLAWL